jgi:hypothetical protein
LIPAHAIPISGPRIRTETYDTTRKMNPPWTIFRRVDAESLGARCSAACNGAHGCSHPWPTDQLLGHQDEDEREREENVAIAAACSGLTRASWEISTGAVSVLPGRFPRR